MSSPPAHDPLSEEMDLITWQEAAARLYDESVHLEFEIANLSGRVDLNADQQTELASLTKRLEAMRRVEQRLRAQRPANSPNRTPHLPTE